MICKTCGLLVLPEEGDEGKAPKAIICAGHLPEPRMTVTIPERVHTAHELEMATVRGAPRRVKP